MHHQEFFARGFLVLKDLFEPSEVAAWRLLLSSDLANHRYLWRPVCAMEHIANFDILVSAPEVESLLRHPRLVATVSELMQEEVCFDDAYFTYVPSGVSSPSQTWHRDCRPVAEHSLGLAHMAVMVYLNDVDAKSHCFCVAPEDVPHLIASGATPGTLAERPADASEIHGPAGTCILFNPALSHTVVVREQGTERAAFHAYYGRRGAPYQLWHDSVVPRWVRTKDAASERFYERINRRTKLFENGAELDAGRRVSGAPKAIEARSP